jgi:hypothetical protein
VSRRIGVDYAGEAAKWPLRFFDLDSPAVSGKNESTVNSRQSTGSIRKRPL